MQNYTHSEIPIMAATLSAVKNWPHDVGNPCQYALPAVVTTYGNEWSERESKRLRGKGFAIVGQK
jgi:hypothetical protein